MTRRLIVDDRDPSGVAPDNPIWRRLREIISFVNGSRILHGRLITAERNALDGSGLVFAANIPRSIPHGLGRKAVGMIEVLGPDLADGGLGLKPSAHPAGITSDNYVTVVSTSNGRTFLWVF